jgi:hypothetical protein
MEGKTTLPRVHGGKIKERRPWGKSPLEFDLSQAVDAVSDMAQQGKILSESQLAAVLGNTITSSAFTRKIRALVVYGLLTEQAGAQFALTDLALAIALPRSPGTQMDAKKEAFLKVDQFSFLFSQHKGKILPADEFLRNILEQECGIPRDNSQSWVNHFKIGASVAGLFHSRGDGKIQISESPISNQSATPHVDESREIVESAPVGLESNGSHGAVEPVGPLRPSQLRQLTDSGHYTRIDLSDGRRAEISIPDTLSPKDAQRLKKALEGIMVIIDSMVSDVK